MELQLVYYGNPLLRRLCLPIEEITDEIRQLVGDMIETMEAKNGIGLAAPQVGRSIRLFVLKNYVEQEEGKLSLSEPRVYINPRVRVQGEKRVADQEGCLSIPGIRAEVERPWDIVVEALDVEGRAFVEEIQGYNARVRLHENDHLNGVLFIDRLSKHARQKLQPLLHEIKTNYGAL